MLFLLSETNLIVGLRNIVDTSYGIKLYLLAVPILNYTLNRLMTVKISREVKKEEIFNVINRYYNETMIKLLHFLFSSYISV